MSEFALLHRHVHELNHINAGLVLGGLTAANGGFNPGTELMDALFDAVIKEQVATPTPGPLSRTHVECPKPAAPDATLTSTLSSPYDITQNPKSQLCVQPPAVDGKRKAIAYGCMGSSDLRF